MDEDTIVSRSNEVLGYVVIGAGSGTMSGVSYWAALGSDIVRGPGNAPPYLYNPGASSACSLGVATQAAMDGADGSWAVLYGSDPVSAGGLELMCDEDQFGGAERSHTIEQVGYIVFAD